MKKLKFLEDIKQIDEFEQEFWYTKDLKIQNMAIFQESYKKSCEFL